MGSNPIFQIEWKRTWYVMFDNAEMHRYLEFIYFEVQILRFLEFSSSITVSAAIGGLPRGAGRKWERSIIRILFFELLHKQDNLSLDSLQTNFSTKKVLVRACVA